ncbi:CDP-diacylglycerol diphosphatase [Candidatus Mycobacterium wuenschmannii]|uniref:CDP-diacylglycerol diphosphatase n=1 Tax=Candidatus Mycobacterium wuenschmannii TaxID=3027808 RepID=A0ABY8VWJ9_9MYCO|nr:CDP-diacylglycerol diphosphatase [Candidatus Mycobacterium wuenschmannii]WIM88024.1 CDP-diacylglycerol diphosphatase [Candidatus Mycobacterium wuenschmannii]
MAQESSTNQGVSRRLFIATSAAVGASAALAGTGIWPAFADPAGGNCGSDNDDVSLWKDVKDATPQAPGSNKKVEFPTNPKNPERKDGYAVHTGGPGFGAWDWLILPLIRATGIECHKSWAPDQMLNLWPWAGKWANDSDSHLAGQDWVLAINSGNTHKIPQLHIHVTKFDNKIRKELTAALKTTKPATTASDWSKHTVTLDNRLYRWLQLGSLDHQLFTEVRNYVAKSDGAMADQIIAVVQVDHTKPGSGFYILNSDKALSSHAPFGIDYVENLMYRG